MTSQETTDPGQKSAAELEREVEAKRAEVEEDLENLQDKLSPGQMMDQLFDYVKDGDGAEFTRNLGRSVRDNPMPLMLIGAGIAWMMASGNGSSRRRYDDDDWSYRPYSGRSSSASLVDSGGYPLSGDDDSDDDSEGLSDKAKRAVTDIRDRASAMQERAGDSMRRAGESAEEYKERLRWQAEHYGRRAKRSFFDTLEEQPLVLGAIGVAVGAALGAALPPTEREDELMGDTRDQLRDRAVEEGQKQAEKAKQVAGAAAEAAKDEAQTGSASSDQKSENTTTTSGSPGKGQGDTAMSRLNDPQKKSS